jgi:hypothetical protein
VLVLSEEMAVPDLGIALLVIAILIVLAILTAFFVVRVRHARKTNERRELFIAGATPISAPQRKAVNVEWLPESARLSDIQMVPAAAGSLPSVNRPRGETNQYVEMPTLSNVAQVDAGSGDAKSVRADAVARARAYARSAARSADAAAAVDSANDVHAANVDAWLRCRHRFGASSARTTWGQLCVAASESLVSTSTTTHLAQTQLASATNCTNATSAVVDAHATAALVTNWTTAARGDAAADRRQTTTSQLPSSRYATTTTTGCIACRSDPNSEAVISLI